MILRSGVTDEKQVTTHSCPPPVCFKSLLKRRVAKCVLGEESFLGSTKLRVSSSCTGAYTAEMALAVVMKTINDSNYFSHNVSFVSKSCHDTGPKDSIFDHTVNWGNGLKQKIR